MLEYHDTNFMVRVCERMIHMWPPAEQVRFMYHMHQEARSSVKKLVRSNARTLVRSNARTLVRPNT